MKVLVTGGTGYVGINLVHALSDSQHEGMVLARKSSPTSLLPATADIVFGDVMRPTTLKNALKEADAVVHLAAVRGSNDTSKEGKKHLDYELAKQINVDGTENLLNAAQECGVETFVHASTIYAHPDISPPREVNQAASIYAETKAASDSLLVDCGWDFNYAIVYPTYILGPRDYRMKRFEPFQIVASNKVIIPPLYMPGRVNIVHMDTVVGSIQQLLSDPTNDREVISGPNITNRKYVAEIAEVCGGRRIVLPFPLYERLIPKLANPLHSAGLLPVSGDRLAELTRTLGVVPDVYAETAPAPVEQYSVKHAVQETYDWFVSVGLL
jgi:nucleoside-diphosphate-sugar epimerase